MRRRISSSTALNSGAADRGTYTNTSANRLAVTKCGGLMSMSTTLTCWLQTRRNAQIAPKAVPVPAEPINTDLALSISSVPAYVSEGLPIPPTTGSGL